MLTPSVMLFLFALLFTCLCYHVLSTYLKLRNIPGPVYARFTNLQRILWIRTLRSQDIYLGIHDQYGAVVRVGPNSVSISDPTAIQTLYPMRPGFPKSKFYRAFMPYTKSGALPAIFTTQDEKQHRMLKSPVAGLYSLSNVVTFEPFVNQVLDVLFQQLDTCFAHCSATFDIGSWLQYFAFDVMGTMTFSSRYGFLETGTDTGGMIESIWKFMLTVAPMTQIPWLDKLWNKTSFVNRWKRTPSGSPILKIVADHTIERQKDIKLENQQSPSGKLNKRDFLSRFLEIQAGNPEIPPWAITAWTFSNVIAGSDSTAVIMKAVIYNLLAHPKSLQNLREELYQAERANNLSKPYPSWHDVKDLPYLDACVNEAIRLHPPFSLPLERVVPNGGISLCGQYIPAGTNVGMNPYVVNRHRPTFGEDAGIWRPERWLDISEERYRKMDQSIMTFGAGRRVCLGKHVALLEIKKIIPALLLRYEFSSFDRSTYSVENSYFFRQKGINVKIERRTES